MLANAFGTGLRRDVYGLPGRLFDVVKGQPVPDRMNMALRTMAVARRLRVPDGQALAAYATLQGVRIRTLTPGELAVGLPDEARAVFTQKSGKRLSLADKGDLFEDVFGLAPTIV